MKAFWDWFASSCLFLFGALLILIGLQGGFGPQAWIYVYTGLIGLFFCVAVAGSVGLKLRRKGG
jgi:hypothetical protein